MLRDAPTFFCRSGRRRPPGGAEGFALLFTTLRPVALYCATFRQSAIFSVCRSSPTRFAKLRSIRNLLYNLLPRIAIGRGLHVRKQICGVYALQAGGFPPASKHKGERHCSVFFSDVSHASASVTNTRCLIVYRYPRKTSHSASALNNNIHYQHKGYAERPRRRD